MSRKSYTVLQLFPRSWLTNLSLYFPTPTYVPLHAVSEPLIITPDKQKQIGHQSNVKEKTKHPVTLYLLMQKSINDFYLVLWNKAQ